DEGAPEEREAVEHLTAGEDDARIAGESEVTAHLGVLVGTPEREAQLRPPGDALEDRHVEVADVPPGEDVRVGPAEMAEEGLDADALARHEPSGHAFGQPREGAGLPGPDHPDVIAAVSGCRDRVEGPAIEARLNVEREDPQLGHEIGGLEVRVPVDAADAGAPLERPVDAE